MDSSISTSLGKVLQCFRLMVLLHFCIIFKYCVFVLGFLFFYTSAPYCNVRLCLLFSAQFLMPLNISAFEYCVLQSLCAVYCYYYCCNVLLILIKYYCFVYDNNYYL
jgi:hypothetical protein